MSKPLSFPSLPAEQCSDLTLQQMEGKTLQSDVNFHFVPLWMDGWINRGMDGWMDRWVDKWMDVGFFPEAEAVTHGVH